MISLTATNCLNCFLVCKDIVETNMKSRKWCGKRQGTERKIVEEKTRSHLMGSVKNRPFWGVSESVRVFFRSVQEIEYFHVWPDPFLV